MSFGFRGEAVDQNCTEQGAATRHQGQRPGPSSVRRTRDMPLSGGRGDGIAGKGFQEEMGAHPKRLVEDDGSKTCDRPDGNPEHDPTSQVRGRADPATHRRSSAAGAHRTAGMRRTTQGILTRLRAHRSQPVLQSCSGTSPAVWLKCPSAATTPARESSGIDPTSRSISCRRRAVTVSTRRRPPGDRAIRTWRRSRRSVRRVTRPFLTNRSHMRDAVGGVTETASANAATPCGPLDAKTTSERYCVKVTSSPTSASERAAMATRTRLALRTASTSCSSAGAAMGLRCI